MRVAALVLLLSVTACAPQGERDETNEPAAEAAEAATEADEMWVTSERLNRHSCPSESCGVVGQAFFREAVFPIERKGEWTRITKLYDGDCSDGVSRYVDVGSKACTAANGFKDGKFAEWVKSANLSAKQPADPAADAKADEKLVAGSDDFKRHRKQFAKAARMLINEGRCSAAEFEEMGGWVKSVNERDAPVYFTYCGGMTVSNRIYLNAKTGEIYS